MCRAASRTSAFPVLGAYHGASQPYFAGLADLSTRTFSGVARVYAAVGMKRTRDGWKSFEERRVPSERRVVRIRLARWWVEQRMAQMYLALERGLLAWKIWTWSFLYFPSSVLNPEREAHDPLGMRWEGRLTQGVVLVEASHKHLLVPFVDLGRAEEASRVGA